MFLSADEIHNEVEAGRLMIEPFAPELLKPASYVLRLGNRFLRWNRKKEPIVVWTSNAGQSHLQSVQHTHEMILEAGTVVLASTLEKISLPHGLVGIISTVSHLARFGLSVHLNAFLVSPGFGENTPTALTLELVSFNPSPLQVKTGMPACHLAFAHTSSTSRSELLLNQSIYQGHDAPCPPMLYEEFSSILDINEGTNHNSYGTMEASRG